MPSGFSFVTSQRRVPVITGSPTGPRGGYNPVTVPTTQITAFSRPQDIATPIRSSGISLGPATRTTGGIGTSTTRITSGGITAPDVMAQNVAAAQTAAAQGPELAMQIAQQLEPMVAEQFYRNLETAFPGYREIFGQMTGNVGAALRGELPSDVADMIRMFSAEQQMQGTLAATARNLGLTSLERADIGFGQAAQLFDLAQRYLTPPQMDVYGTSENIRNQLAAAGMITPFQAGQLAMESERLELERREQALRQQELSVSTEFKSEDIALQRDRLQAEIAQFNSRMSWDQQLSTMNRQYEEWAMSVQMDLYRRAEAARRQEQAQTTRALEQQLSTLLGGGAYQAPPLQRTTAQPIAALPTTQDVISAQEAGNMPTIV
jgi:hypothetical protein